MEYHAPADCPVCGRNLDITRLRCRHCQTELNGQFTPCHFCRLPEKQLQFVETFLRCRGSIKEVEKALGISYPTVRNMLEAALTALGLEDKGQAPEPHSEEKEDILNRLAQGEIDVEAAVTALSGLKN